MGLVPPPPETIYERRHHDTTTQLSKYTECASHPALATKPCANRGETHCDATRERRCCLDDGQTPAALEPTRLEHSAARARRHSLHKAMLTLARDAFWLPRSLHGLLQIPSDKMYQISIPGPTAGCQTGGTQFHREVYAGTGGQRS